MKKFDKTLKKFVIQKNKKILFTPGPASLLKENIIGLEPCFGRGDSKYDQIEDYVLNKIKKMTGHSHIVRFQGSGSLALEMMTLNFLYGKVLIVKTGYYSDRLFTLSRQAKKRYKNIKKIKYINWKELDNINEKFDWIYSCYTETSIGMKLPIEKLKKTSKRLKSKLMLDATASVGLEDNHDLADVIGFSSCKGLFGLTGAAFICYNIKPSNNIESFYLNLKNQEDKKMTGPYHIICSLKEVLKNHKEFKEAVLINKKKFLKKFSNQLIYEKEFQPNLCTYVNKKIIAKTKNIILYKSRGKTDGSIVSHIGEVHLGIKAKGLIIDKIK